MLSGVIEFAKYVCIIRVTQSNDLLGVQHWRTVQVGDRFDDNGFRPHEFDRRPVVRRIFENADIWRAARRTRHNDVEFVGQGFRSDLVGRHGSDLENPKRTEKKGASFFFSKKGHNISPQFSRPTNTYVPMSSVTE